MSEGLFGDVGKQKLNISEKNGSKWLTAIFFSQHCSLVCVYNIYIASIKNDNSIDIF